MNIPGTNYQIQGNNFVGPDGVSLTQDQFIQKVESKEISLTENSLRFLGEQFGPALENSLIGVSGSRVSPQEISDKLSKSESVTIDVMNVLLLLQQATIDQKKSSQEVRRQEMELNVNLMNQAAQEQLNSAMVKMAVGIASGALTMVSAGVSLAGQLKVETKMNEMKSELGVEKLTEEQVKIAMQEMKPYEIVNTLIDSGNKIGGSIMEGVVAGMEKTSKDTEVNAKRVENLVQTSREMIDSMRDVDAKVQEAVRQTIDAQNETMRTVSRPS